MANSPETNVCRQPDPEAHDTDLNDIALSKVPQTEKVKDEELADTSFAFSRKQEQPKSKQSRTTHSAKLESEQKNGPKPHVKTKYRTSILDHYISLIAKI